eukprot:6088589-Pyramimonas_sp.AAC.1
MVSGGGRVGASPCNSRVWAGGVGGGGVGSSDGATARVRTRNDAAKHGWFSARATPARGVGCRAAPVAMLRPQSPRSVR